MKIDWKHLATTPGYMSLKEAYITDVRKKNRTKAESIRKFQWVINRAKHYASHTGKTIEVILNEWEEKRTYWWLNYYQNCAQPKFHSNSNKPQGINGIRKHYKSCNYYANDPVKFRERMKDFIKKESAKAKPRWTMARKKRGY